MKSKAVSGMMLTLLLIGMLILTFNIQPVKASGTIYIRSDGSVEGTTDILSVDNITYTFTANIFNQSIIIEKNHIVVDGASYTVQGTGSGIGILTEDRSNVTIKDTRIRLFAFGISLKYSSNSNISGNNITENKYEGISLFSSSNCMISGNTITNNEDGIWFNRSSNNTISRNNITNNDYGIHLWELSSNNSINGNNITNNDAMGIAIYKSFNIVLRNNVMAGNSHNFDVSGSALLHLVHDVDESNTVDGKPIYYWINRQDMKVPFNAGYVALINSVNITVEGLELKNNGKGILLANTTNSRITNNNITSTYQAINFYESSSNTISKSNITNNLEGISLYSSSNNTISRNNITENYYAGIRLYSSSNNTISRNNITNNDGEGIYLEGSSNCMISGNTITNNNWGICMQASSNTIYHNNFINNTQQVHFYISSYTNVWEDGYPSSGNYWSDYLDVDLLGGPYQNETGSDGIGDTSYNIDVNNQDNYPLIGMFSDFVATPEYHVQTVCNSSISDFQFNGTAICFNVTGENDTTGFCRICVPRALMNETYKVFVNGTEVPCNLLPCSNTTHSYLYFTYNHSTQEVIIIPEFPSLLILPLFMMVTLLAAIVYRRKHSMLH